MQQPQPINLTSLVQGINDSVRATNALNETIDGKFPDAFVTVPTTTTDSGETYQMAVSTTHLYICVAANTWRRVALSTF